MIRRNSLCSLALAAMLFTGCAGEMRTRYPSADSPLKLDRVVLYRNGIGYFERVGEVDGDILTLKVRKDQVNDLLKSLTVVEKDTGRAVSVSMPLDPQSWANAALATLQPGYGSLAEVLDALRGTEVSLSTTDGTIAGRIVMVEELVDAPTEGAARSTSTGPYPLPAGNRDHRVTLLDGDEMKVVRLSKVRGVKLQDGDLAMQFNRTLDASAGEGMFQQVEVSIRLAGANSHELLVSYVAAAPMWKPTYRVVLPKDGKGKALLQAWAVVDNTSGEDWSNVNLGLTSGAPIAFRYDLHTPRDVPRSDLTESGVRRQAEAMVGETIFEEAPPPPPAAAPVMPAATEMADASGFDGDDEFGGARRESDKKSGKNKKAEGRPARTPMEAPKAEAAGQSAPGGGYFGGKRDRSIEEEKRPAVDYDSLRRSMQAQARAATVSGQSRFDIDQRVTVPEGTSTMVAIINSGVEGEETFLFRPGVGAGMGYEVNPYRVVRFRNTTPFVLEPGPIAIYAGGSFVGEGLSETVGSGTSATIPFAVETGIMISSTARDDREEMRLVKMSRGILEVEQFARRATTYTAKAQTIDNGYTVLIRHPKSGWNYALAQRPEGTEDLPDGYHIRLAVPAGQREGTITIVEQTPSKSSISIWDRPALDLLEKLLVATDLTPEAKKKLTPIVEKRRELAKLEEQIYGLSEKRNKLDQRAGELRENLRSIEKNTQANAQRQKWTKQLDEFTSEGNKLGAQLAELEAKRLDKRIEMEDLLQDLELTAPAAAPTSKSASAQPAPPADASAPAPAVAPAAAPAPAPAPAKAPAPPKKKP
ncbi:MAG: DUF4139 domain-containing protein [Polyangiaceae bacterium]|nr:DUF4139 domain-containing protein [Polyangiaceae bacterium]